MGKLLKIELSKKTTECTINIEKLKLPFCTVHIGQFKL